MKKQKLSLGCCVMALGLFASSSVSAAMIVSDIIEYSIDIGFSTSGGQHVSDTNPSHTYQPGGGDLSGLSQFDPSMGTLNSAELTLDGEFAYELELTATGIDGTQTHFVNANVNPSVALIVPTGGGGYTFASEITDSVSLGCSAVAPACSDTAEDNVFDTLSELFIGSALTGGGFIGTGDLSEILVGLLYNVDGHSESFAEDAMLDVVNLSFDGTVTVAYDYSPVPIPAAVWLFGSGLIGLFGIAKKRKAG